MKSTHAQLWRGVGGAASPSFRSHGLELPTMLCALELYMGPRYLAAQAFGRDAAPRIDDYLNTYLWSCASAESGNQRLKVLLGDSPHSCSGAPWLKRFLL